MRNKTERYLIQKMAELVAQYQEPYDNMDKEAGQHNLPLETQYKVYKQMLKDLCDF